MGKDRFERDCNLLNRSSAQSVCLMVDRVTAETRYVANSIDSVGASSNTPSWARGIPSRAAV